MGQTAIIRGWWRLVELGVDVPADVMMTRIRRHLLDYDESSAKKSRISLVSTK
jgi:hypothetical protein